MTAVLAVALILAGVDTGFTGYLEATQPAGRVATECVTDADTCNPPITNPRPPSRCGQWFDTAMQVGWPEWEWPTVDYVMHRESRCNPRAYNPVPCGRGNHALGLMQLCGWGGSELYDPTANLTKALELWERSGWCPWVLAGDPVTGRACR